MKRISFLLAAALLGAASTAGAGTIEKAREAGKLTIGYLKDARPYASTDGLGKPAGYAIALCGKVADALKAQANKPELAVDYVALGPDEAFAALQQGRIDLLCGAVPSLGRRATVDFSIPVMLTGAGAAVRRDAPARLVEVLEARESAGRPVWRGSGDQAPQRAKVAVVAGIPLEKQLETRLKERRIVAELVTVKDVDAGLQALASGGADAFFLDRSLLLDAVTGTKAPGNVRVLDRMYGRNVVALAVRRDDDDFRLLVDRALSRMYRSQEIQPLYARFFGPPTGMVADFFQTIALPD